MIILPAIDILGGNCVRLVRGAYESASRVAADPFETLLSFAEAGADYIHMVDLDGAKAGAVVNRDVFLKAASLTDVPIELGGGIRTMETVDDYLSNGISRVILGSAALRSPDFVRQAVDKYGEKIAVGIDAKNGLVSADGWLKTSEVNYLDFARLMEEMGVKTVIFTDISRDGTLTGPSLSMLSALKATLKPETQLTASGGIKSMDDIAALKKLDVYGAICGKSLYSGTLPLREAIEFCKKENGQ